MMNFDAIESYPLHWPPAFRRTAASERKRANFGRVTQREGMSYTSKERMTVAVAARRLTKEISSINNASRSMRVDPDALIVSTNIKIKLDGLPYSNQRDPDDPGVAVYFKLDGVPHCLPCDRWSTVADNLAAIAAHIGAMCGMERWGVGDIRAAFAGYKALPGATIQQAMTVEEAARFIEQAAIGSDPQMAMGVVAEILRDSQNYRALYREAAKMLHPDTGGSTEQFNQLQEAKRILDAHHKR